MKPKILGIEKSEILLNNLSKIISLKMDVINIPNQNRSFFNCQGSIKFFKSRQTLKQLDELLRIKPKYDLILTSSWEGAKLAFFGGMKYIIYFIGDDIRYPSLTKKINIDSKIAKKLKRRNITNKEILKNASGCVTGSDELFKLLKKYRKDAYRIDRIVITSDLKISKKRNHNLKNVKFTFFCPVRIGREKGTDLLWKSLNYCKTDFQIIQINWIDKRNRKIKDESKQILKKIPKNVKLIKLVPHEKMGNYYSTADCIIGEMKTGHTSSIEREAAVFKKPIISYSNPSMKAILDGKKVTLPFLPKSNNPIEIAKVIDKIVENKKFRTDLANREYKFMKNLTDPYKTANEWQIMINEIFKSQC